MAKWLIDGAHSEIGFKVRHMMISNVSGKFEEFTAEMEAAKEDFSDATFSFSAVINSINTGVADRDGHLKSPDFFDAEAHPNLTFTSTGVTVKGDGVLEIAGEMSIRGTVNPVVLKAENAGVVVDPYGQTKTGFSIIGKIKRSEFGLVWSAVTEAGSIVVGDEVTLNCEVQFVKG